MLRHRLTLLAACCAVSFAATAPALADDYPSKAVKLVVGYTPGGPNDIMARALAAELNLGQTVYIENRGGASGNIAAEMVARAPADGYTLMMETSSGAANATLYRKLNYDLRKDFTHIAFVAAYPLVLVVHPSVPATNVKELLALAKAKPGALNYASGGSGGGAHLATELFKTMAGIDMLHIPYNGTSPGLLGVVGGQAQVMFAAMSAAMPHVQSGRLRALGVTGSTRTASEPDIPTIAEAGVPGYEVLGWLGLGAPAGLPPAITAKLNAAVARAVRSPRMIEYMAKEGWQPMVMSPADYTTFSNNEIEKWGKVVTDSGARVD